MNSERLAKWKSILRYEAVNAACEVAFAGGSVVLLPKLLREGEAPASLREGLCILRRHLLPHSRTRSASRMLQLSFSPLAPQLLHTVETTVVKHSGVCRFGVTH